MVKTMNAVRQMLKASAKVAKMRKSMMPRRMLPRRMLGADAASRGPPRTGQVVRVPKGSMVIADYKPDRVREFYDPATGKTLYRKRG